MLPKPRGSNAEQHKRHSDALLCAMRCRPWLSSLDAVEWWSAPCGVRPLLQRWTFRPWQLRVWHGRAGTTSVAGTGKGASRHCRALLPAQASALRKVSGKRAASSDFSRMLTQREPLAMTTKSWGGVLHCCETISNSGKAARGHTVRRLTCSLGTLQAQ